MNKLLYLVLAILVVAFCATPALAIATEAWEAYTADDDAAVEIYGNIWAAQTFTVGTEAHTVSQVRLKLYRELTPSTVTVSIRETTGGDPSGTDLTSGTLDGDDFTDASGGVWYSFDLTPYSLEASTMYAIVVRAVAGDATHSAWWRSDSSAGAEANGQEETSDNAGTTWTGDADDDFMFEIWGEALIAVNSAQVFTGYLEDDDLLFVLEYENTYVPYYPSSSPTAFFVQLVDDNDTTVISQTVCRAWGNKPGSFYLSADQATALESGEDYRLRLYGDFTGNPSASYTLQSSDWKGSELSYLDDWVILTAHNLEDYYSIDFVIATSAGLKLNEEGGVIFASGIPALSSERPDLFQVAVHVPQYEGETWTDAFAGATTWQAQVGPTFTAFFNAGGNLINIDGQIFGAVLIFIAFIGIAALATAGGHAQAGLVLAVPIVLAGAWLRLIDIIIVGVIAAVLMLLFVWSFWWSRT